MQAGNGRQLETAPAPVPPTDDADRHVVPSQSAATSIAGLKTNDEHVAP